MLVLAVICALLWGNSPAAPDDRDAPATSAATVFDEQAEIDLLRRVNDARARVGAPPLATTSELIVAARQHALEMLRHEKISHQFPGEADLKQRLAGWNTHFDKAGENVAMDFSAEEAQDSLMGSPGHRANLLNPAFNAVGIGIAREGSRLYVVQDFVRALPKVEGPQAEEQIAQRVNRLRQQTRLPQLQRQPKPELRDTACDMARHNRIDTKSAPATGRPQFVLSYTEMSPDEVPASAGKYIADASIKRYSVGACYAQNQTYPSGAYYVMMLFY
jgi:uncharacterized protein YkwD